MQTRGQKTGGGFAGEGIIISFCLPVCSGLHDGVPGHCLLPCAPLLAMHRWLKAQHCLRAIGSVMAEEEEWGLQRFFVVEWSLVRGVVLPDAF